MRNSKVLLIIMAGLLLAVAGSASAQSTPLNQGAISAADLLDKKVETRDGKQIGTVSDLIVDTSGDVAYIVVSHDGVQGLNDRLTPVPISAFDERANHDALILDMDRSRLDKAPHFAKKDWPPNYDRERWESWDQEVRGYYDQNGIRGGAGGVGPGGSDSNTPGTGSVSGSSSRGKAQ